MGQRFFNHDVFLSHNRDDGSHMLRDGLVRLGATAWHDGYADMSGANVQLAIDTALSDSRFICVCVGADYRDSEWVRAEYLPGLAIEKKFKVPRVIVARMCGDVSLPRELAKSPVFAIARDGAGPLAAHALLHNGRTPKGTPEPNADAERQVRVEQALKLRSLIGHHSRTTLSYVEKLRLTVPRLVSDLTRSDLEPLATASSILEIFRERVRPNGYGFYSARLGEDGSEEQTLAAELLTQFAAHPERLRQYLSEHSARSEVLFTLLGALMSSPCCRERASIALAKVLDVYAAESSTGDALQRTFRRDQLLLWHRFKADLEAGEPLLACQQRRRAAESALLRGGFKGWLQRQRLQRQSAKSRSHRSADHPPPISSSVKR